MNTFLTKPRWKPLTLTWRVRQFANRFKSPSHLEHQTRLGLTHLGIKNHATEDWETPTSWLPPPLSHARVLLFVHIQPSEQWRPDPLCHLLSHLPLLTKAPKVITMKRKRVSITQVLTMFSKNKDKHKSLLSKHERSAFNAKKNETKKTKILRQILLTLHMGQMNSELFT